MVQSINQNHGKVTNIAKIKAQIRLSEIQMEHIPGTKKVTVSVLLNNKALANATSYAEVVSITKVGEIKVSSMSAAGMPGLVGIHKGEKPYTNATDENKAFEKLFA